SNPFIATGANEATGPRGGAIPASLVDSDGGQSAPGFAGEDAARSMAGYGYPGFPGYSTQPRCSATLPAVLNGNAVDLGAVSFELRSPGAGYTLQTFNVRAEGECDETGRASEGDVAVDSSWIHDETGIGVWVSQRVAAEP